jgi:DNA primase
MDSPIEEIKSRLDIVEFISQYLKLRKSGANYNAVCPFHSEKSGSFFVSPTRQMWRCFGCQKGGDIFTFVQEIEGVEFGDALRILAAKAGVELKRQTRESVEMKTERQRLYDVCELAAKFFEKQLEGNAQGKEARKYLLGRGLSEESVVSWRIGYSPDAWQGLHDFLASEGYDDSEIIAAGLAASSDRGRVYDRFRGRIMFPIFDFNSQVVGFGGRIFGTPKEGEAKYLNTTNTLLYDKSRLLYGLDRAKVAIRKHNACILVEGYTDVIMSAQAGVDNVAASSGTALTPYQLKILKRFTDNIILGYDMDLAGDTANSRGIDLALAQGFNVSVARPPYEDKDPADVIALDPEVWRKAVANTKTIMEFYFERAFAGKDAANPQGKRQIAALLLPPIKRIINTIEQSFWLQRLSRDLGVREEDLREELKKVRLNEYAPAPDISRPASVLTAKTREQRVEERVLALLLKFPQSVKIIDDSVLAFFSENGQEIISALKSGQISADNFTGPLKDYCDTLLILAESDVSNEKDAANEIECHVYGDYGIRDCQLKNQMLKLRREIAVAESKKDQQKVSEILAKIGSISKSVQDLKLRNNDQTKK